MASTLQDIGLVLTQLGVYEMADDVMARAHNAHVRRAAGRTRSTCTWSTGPGCSIGWGLRLERVERFDEARASSSPPRPGSPRPRRSPFRSRCTPAAGTARPPSRCRSSVRRTRWPTRDGSAPRPAVRPCATLSMYARELIIVAIALARCLVRGEPRGKTR